MIITHKQIGLNYLHTDAAMWYTLADIIASKLLTGRCPQIIRAIRIIPEGVQDDLQSIKICNEEELEINPAVVNFFKKVIELRQDYKKLVKTVGDNKDSMQKFLKTLANSTSYGVYIELNREEEKKDIDVYGLNSFTCQTEHWEKPGRLL